MEKTLISVWRAHPELSEGLRKVEAYLEDQLSKGHPLISDAVISLLRAGGKRIRPALVLASGLVGEAPAERLVPIAAAIEIVHMATLVHDDIVDEAHTRRGVPTIHTRYSKDVAVFTGDYLFTKAFRILSAYASPDMLKSVAAVVQEMCEGEMEQYEARLNTDVSFGDYLRRIRQKTAALFALSCYAGAYGVGSSNGTADSLRRFGLHLGMAFQIADDVLDFSRSSAVTGKPVLHDFACGVYTLPIIYALRSPGSEEKLRKLLVNPKLEDPEARDEIARIVKESGALRRAARVGERYAARARRCLSSLPGGPGKRILGDILESAIHRDH